MQDITLAPLLDKTYVYNRAITGYDTGYNAWLRIKFAKQTFWNWCWVGSDLLLVRIYNILGKLFKLMFKRTVIVTWESGYGYF